MTSYEALRYVYNSITDSCDPTNFILIAFILFTGMFVLGVILLALKFTERRKNKICSKKENTIQEKKK